MRATPERNLMYGIALCEATAAARRPVSHLSYIYAVGLLRPNGPGSGGAGGRKQQARLGQLGRIRKDPPADSDRADEPEGSGNEHQVVAQRGMAQIHLVQGEPDGQQSLHVRLLG